MEAVDKEATTRSAHAARDPSKMLSRLGFETLCRSIRSFTSFEM